MVNHMSGDCDLCCEHPTDCKCTVIHLTKTSTDIINNPSHYKGNGMEAIDVIEGFGLGFRLGNAVKYILRAGRKDNRVQDLQKAIWYIQREIEKG